MHYSPNIGIFDFCSLECLTMYYKTINDEKLIDKVLSTAEICNIAMHDGNDIYLVPMFYGYDSHKIYMYSEKKSKKIDMLRHDNTVTFSIISEAVYDFADSEMGDNLECISIQGKGTAGLLTGNDQKCKALRNIKHRYAGQNHDCSKMSSEKIDSIVIIEITIDELSCRIFGL